MTVLCAITASSEIGCEYMKRSRGKSVDFSDMRCSLSLFRECESSEKIYQFIENLRVEFLWLKTLETLPKQIWKTFPQLSLKATLSLELKFPELIGFDGSSRPIHPICPEFLSWSQ